MVVLLALLSASIAAGQDMAGVEPLEPAIPEAEAQAAGDRHGAGTDGEVDGEVDGDDSESGEPDEEDGAPRHRLLLRSTELGDDVRVSRIGRDASSSERNHWTCTAPCSLRLDTGEYRVEWSAAGLDEEISLDSDMLAEGRGGSTLEVVTGIFAVVIGGVILTVALLTGEGACFELDPEGCSVGNGPLALGVGTFGVLFGLFLMIDSTGYVELTDF